MKARSPIEEYEYRIFEEINYLFLVQKISKDKYPYLFALRQKLQEKADRGEI